MSKAGRVSSAGNVVGIVRNLIDERASKTVGRIRMLHEGAMEGAAFDLPEEVALEVLAKKHELEVRKKHTPPPFHPTCHLVSLGIRVVNHVSYMTACKRMTMVACSRTSTI